MLFFKNNIWKIIKIIKSDEEILRQARIVNIHRICFIGWMMGSINIIHIVLFLLYMPKGPAVIVLWYKLIIIIHSVMLVVNAALGLLAIRLRKLKKIIECL